MLQQPRLIIVQVPQVDLQPVLSPPVALQELVPVEVVGALTEVADELAVWWGGEEEGRRDGG